MQTGELRRKRLVVGLKAVRCWMLPCFRSYFSNGRFQPILSFLFTDLACNYRCYYCYGSHMPHVRSMTMDTATTAVDWLQSLGCRVLAFMGGEPLVRKAFVLDAARYASDRNFYVYLPTNGFYLDEEFVDAAAEAGIDVFNLALDCVEEKPGLPKALDKVRPQYEMLLEKSRKRHFLVMFNVNINPHNTDDVRRLTEIAHGDGINVDYHVVEPPLQEQAHFATQAESIGFLPKDYEEVDALLDWLGEKYREGYQIANSPRHFVEAKKFIRGEPLEWSCRAGINTLVIMPDGRLKPCFEYFNDPHDWGTVGHPQFDRQRLAALKQQCTRRCMSTCNYTTAYYRAFDSIFQWVGKYFRVRG